MSGGLSAGEAVWTIRGDKGELENALRAAASDVQSTTAAAEQAAVVGISGDASELDSTLDGATSEVESSIDAATGAAVVGVSGDASELNGTLDDATESVAGAIGEANESAVVAVSGDASELDGTLDEIPESVSSAIESAGEDAVVEITGDAADVDSTLDEMAGAIASAMDEANAAAHVEATGDGSDAAGEMEGVVAATEAAMDEANAAAHVEATADVSDVTSSMDEAVSAVTSAADEMNFSLSSIGKGMSIAGLGITGVLGGMVMGFASVGDEIQKMALRTGISTESLSRMKFVMEQNGSGLQQFEMATRFMTRTIDEAKQGTEMQVEALARLGLSYESLQSLSPEEQFKTIAFAIGGLNSHTEMAAAAMEIFGARTGTQLLPMIKAGAGSFAELSSQAEELGMVFDQTGANEAAAFTDSMNELKHSFQGVMIELGPIIGQLMQELLPIIKSVLISLREWIAENPNLTTGLIAVAGAGGLLMDAIGPLLMALPGILSYMKLSTIAASAAAPAIAGVGTAAGTAAGATGIGALTAGLAGIAWPVAAGVAIGAGLIAIGASAWETKKSFDQLEESEAKTAAMGERYTQHLRDKGIAFNEAAMAAMGLSEKVKYGAEAEKQAADISARAWFEHFAGRTETEKEFGQMRSLMLNEHITAEEAAIAVSKNLNEQTIKELMKADKQKTDAMLNNLGIREQAEQQTITEITSAELNAARERNQIWLEQTHSLVEYEKQKAQEVGQTWGQMLAEIGLGIASLPVMAVDALRGLAGYAPLQGARASGGPVSGGSPYLVGEEGPELFVPRVSGQVISAPQTAAAMGGGSQTININMGGVTLANNMDVDAVARRLGDKLRQRITGVGACTDWRRV